MSSTMINSNFANLPSKLVCLCHNIVSNSVKPALAKQTRNYRYPMTVNSPNIGSNEFIAILNWQSQIEVGRHQLITLTVIC